MARFNFYLILLSSVFLINTSARAVFDHPELVVLTQENRKFADFCTRKYDAAGDLVLDMQIGGNEYMQLLNGIHEQTQKFEDEQSLALETALFNKRWDILDFFGGRDYNRARDSFEYEI